jgi:hypothetical protein
MALSASNIQAPDSPRSDNSSTWYSVITLDDLDATGRAIRAPSRASRPTSSEIRDRGGQDEQSWLDDHTGRDSHEEHGLLSASKTAPKRQWSRKCCGEYPGFGALQITLSIFGIIILILFAVYIKLPANKDTKETNHVSQETQKWQAYYTWRWEVCPKELVSSG